MNTKNPLVSIIVAAYNSQDWIQTAVASCLNQTYENVEVVVVDDASTDGTQQAVLGLDDKRVRLVRQLENTGPGPARDRGIEESTGDWMAILDADDAMHPDRIKRLMEVGRAKGRQTVVVDRFKRFNALSPRSSAPSPERLKIREIDVIDHFVRHTTGGFPFFSRELRDATGALHPPTRFGEDTAFIVQLMSPAAARLVLLDEPLYYYRVAKDSLSLFRDRQEQDRAFEFLLAYGDLPETYRRAIEAARRRLRVEVRYEELASAVRTGGPTAALRLVAADPSLVWSAARVRGRWLWYRTRQKARRISRRVPI